MAQAEKAFLAKVAVSEDQAEREQEERELQQAIALSEDESAARVAAENLVSLSETEDESTTAMETHMELVETPKLGTGRVAVKRSHCSDPCRRSRRQH